MRITESYSAKRRIIISMKKKSYTSEQKSTLTVSVTTAFITTFMGSALNLSAPDIERELGVNAAAVGWVVTVYMLTCAALAVPFGKIADRIERKRILWIGIFIFWLCSAAGIFSRSVIALIFARFGQGIGASMIFSTNIAILVGAFGEEMRGRVLGYSTSSTYAGLSAGPVLGGFLNHNLGWRAIFAAAAVVSAAALYGALKKLPAEKREINKTPMDWRGTGLYAAAVVSLMYGLSSLTLSENAVFAFILGIILMFFFIRTELKQKYPVLDVRMFRKNISYAFSNLAALLNYGATYAVSYLISIYLQVVAGFDSQRAGMILLASPLIMSLLSPVMGRLSDKYSPHIMSSAGMGFCALALVLFAFMPRESGVLRIIGMLSLSGAGFALFTSPNTNAVMASVDKKDYGVASSVLATMRSVGHTVSMAVVMLIMGAFLGNTSFSEADPNTLMDIFHVCFYVFTALCAAGIFIALRRKT